MKKWNLVIDVAKCFNCQACAITCHDEYHGNDFPGYAASMPNHQRWIEIRTREKGRCPMVEVAYLPVTCNHCDNPPCLRAAKDGAVRKRDDGIVIIDPVKAKGQKQLVDACPYGHIWWNDELGLPQAWPFDAHLLDGGWDKTRVAQSCPTTAMRTVKLDDEEMAQMVRAEGLEVLRPELGTKPRVYYKNLWRFSTAFIGGSVSEEKSGIVDCAEGAIVHLLKDGREIAKVATDNYGDFKLDKLPENSGAYTLEITFAGRRATREATLGESINLGDIRI